MTWRHHRVRGAMPQTFQPPHFVFLVQAIPRPASRVRGAYRVWDCERVWGTTRFRARFFNTQQTRDRCRGISIYPGKIENENNGQADKLMRREAIVGGTFGPASNPGATGGVTRVSFTNTASGTTNITASAGAGGTSISPAQSTTGDGPGDRTFIDKTFYGRACQTVSGYAGNPPGGGGAGARNIGVNPGGPGAGGIAWLNSRQN